MNLPAQSFLAPAKRIALSIFLVLLAVWTVDAGQTEPPPDEGSIPGIVKKAQNGDDLSFDALYRSYYTQIYAYLVRLVGNHEDASDLAQETFTRAWRSLPGVHDGQRFRSWLYRIATNAALDHLRRQKRSRRFWEHQGQEAIDEHIVRLEGRVEEQELVQLALQHVTPKLRACLVLQLEGFSQQEIAQLMGLSRKSVGTYVSIAREQFRQAYSRLENL